MYEEYRVLSADPKGACCVSRHQFLGCSAFESSNASNQDADLADVGEGEDSLRCKLVDTVRWFWFICYLNLDLTYLYITYFHVSVLVNYSTLIENVGW